MKPVTARLFALAALAFAGRLAAPVQAQAMPRQYEVVITNLTRAQRFTPILVATHAESVQLFHLGMPASPELRKLAEEGDIGPLKMLLENNPDVSDVVNTPPPPPPDRLIAPGTTVKIEVGAWHGAKYLSLAAMLIPTNDAFVALNGVRLPEGDKVVEFFAVAYDAGTERNDELCASIPGPGFAECITGSNPAGNGGGAAVGGGEGFVYVHNGMHGVGNFMAAMRDWRNPVAKVTIRRIH